MQRHIDNHSNEQDLKTTHHPEFTTNLITHIPECKHTDDCASKHYRRKNGALVWVDGFGPELLSQKSYDASDDTVRVPIWEEGSSTREN